MKHRITLSDEAYLALQTESIVSKRPIQDLLNEFVMNSVSQKAKTIMESVAADTDIEIESEPEPVIEANKPTDQITMKPSEQRARATSLSEDEIVKIKQLYNTTSASRAQIARQMRRARTTINDAINRLIERGELKDRP